MTPLLLLPLSLSMPALAQLAVALVRWAQDRYPASTAELRWLPSSRSSAQSSGATSTGARVRARVATQTRPMSTMMIIMIIVVRTAVSAARAQMLLICAHLHLHLLLPLRGASFQPQQPASTLLGVTAAAQAAPVPTALAASIMMWTAHLAICDTVLCTDPVLALVLALALLPVVVLLHVVKARQETTLTAAALGRARGIAAVAAHTLLLLLLPVEPQQLLLPRRLCRRCPRLTRSWRSQVVVSSPSTNPASRPRWRAARTRPALRLWLLQLQRPGSEA